MLSLIQLFILMSLEFPGDKASSDLCERCCSCVCLCCRFSELSWQEPAQAVSYLQNEVSAVVDHDNPKEREQVWASLSVWFALFVWMLTLQRFAGTIFVMQAKKK